MNTTTSPQVMSEETFANIDLYTLIAVLSNTLIQLYSVYRSGHHRFEMKNCKYCGDVVWESDSKDEASI